MSKIKIDFEMNFSECKAVVSTWYANGLIDQVECDSLISQLSGVQFDMSRIYVRNNNVTLNNPNETREGYITSCLEMQEAITQSDNSVNN